MSDDHDFQKKAGQITNPSISCDYIGGILIALGITVIVTQIPRELYPWNGFALLGVGLALMLSSICH